MSERWCLSVGNKPDEFFEGTKKEAESELGQRVNANGCEGELWKYVCRAVPGERRRPTFEPPEEP